MTTCSGVLSNASLSLILPPCESGRLRRKPFSFVKFALFFSLFFFGSGFCHLHFDELFLRSFSSFSFLIALASCLLGVFACCNLGCFSIGVSLCAWLLPLASLSMLWFRQLFLWRIFDLGCIVSQLFALAIFAWLAILPFLHFFLCWLMPRWLFRWRLYLG